MAAPELRYATTLTNALGAAGGSITIASLDNLQGNDGTNADASALVADSSGLRLLKPGYKDSDPDTILSYTAEVVEFTGTPTDNGDGTHTLSITRDQTSFVGGAKSKGTGTYDQGVDGTISFTADTDANYAFPVGSVVENLNTDALLRAVSAGATADDYISDLPGGFFQFKNVAATAVGGYQVATGMTISAFFEYASASSQRVNLGEKLPDMEYIVEFQHQMPDNRYFKGYFHRGAVTPDSVEFAFDPSDWLGAVMPIDLLKSSDSANALNPYGWLDIENNPITLQAPTERTDNLTAGVYELFITPTDASVAAQRGLPVQRYSVGNVRIGNFTSPQEFLEHLVGIPQDLNKKIRIRRQYRLETTIEEVTAINLAMLFDGRISNVNAGYLPANTLLTVAADPPGDYDVTNVWHTSRFILLNPA